MFTKLRLRLLRKRISKLRESVNKLEKSNDEVIKFLTLELFKEVDSYYNIDGGHGMKAIDVYKHNTADEIKIENVLTDFIISVHYKED